MDIRPTNRSRVKPPNQSPGGALDSHSNPNEVQVLPAEHGTGSDTLSSTPTFNQENLNTQEVLKKNELFGNLVDEAYKKLGVDLKPET